MITEAVIDASLAVKLVVPEDYSAVARALSGAWIRDGIQAVAPPLFPFEVANALHRKVVRGALVFPDALEAFQTLMASGIQLRDTDGLHLRALELATATAQSAAYDAHYLALAEALNCELWTADRRFTRSVQQVSENVHWIGEYAGGG